MIKGQAADVAHARQIKLGRRRGAAAEKLDLRRKAAQKPQFGGQTGRCADDKGGRAAKIDEDWKMPCHSRTSLPALAVTHVRGYLRSGPFS